jgi:hypothetical protein
LAANKMIFERWVLTAVDIFDLRRYRQTYNVPVNEFEDGVTRFQIALAFGSVAEPELLFPS